MQFTCSTSKLIEALQIATKALANRTTNQILEGVLIETDMEELTLTCSDERITIITRIPADISEPGRGVVPGKLFSASKASGIRFYKPGCDVKGKPEKWNEFIDWQLSAALRLRGLIKELEL